ncbi:hypothetical protein OCU04_008373 [Sclerotinia nivalis]|uniref:Uncharacterized protein n=1 Tax=Sclerotinia nivalis TaxID=352851 RepID=A0A9X0AI60_9HELO|nr:hypothetical protein OCU04_008373 [Sclerotinia nivalis]
MVVQMISKPCMDPSTFWCVHLLLPHTEKRLLDEAFDVVSSFLPKFIYEGPVHHWQGLAIASSAIPVSGIYQSILMAMRLGILVEPKLHRIPKKKRDQHGV